ncbi:hypothetical protein [Pseudomonas sp. Teo4]|uniref:hypothetical protein n=1 Tax=Pseudomonas sp. Teo4 TaxID=3064528 RepID=UPI002ACB1169|nr:hypothetical protein [Pseudomonas sp. Teo4]
MSDDAHKIVELDSAIKQAFKIFDKSTFEGGIGYALAGEVYGSASFDCLAADSLDFDEKRFWEASRDVELLTLKKLRAYVAEIGLSQPDEQTYEVLGQMTARVFSGAPHFAYCEWVAPQILIALSDFNLLKELLGRSELSIELFEHEAAFASAWRGLGEGFGKAIKPLEKHLLRYGQGLGV